MGPFTVCSRYPPSPPIRCLASLLPPPPTHSPLHRPHYPCQHSTHLPCNTPSLPLPSPDHTHSQPPQTRFYTKHCNQTRHASTCRRLQPSDVSSACRNQCSCRLVMLKVEWHFWHVITAVGLKDHLTLFPGSYLAKTYKKEVKVAESVVFLTQAEGLLANL